MDTTLIDSPARRDKPWCAARTRGGRRLVQVLRSDGRRESLEMHQFVVLIEQQARARRRAALADLGQELLAALGRFVKRVSARRAATLGEA